MGSTMGSIKGPGSIASAAISASNVNLVEKPPRTMDIKAGNNNSNDNVVHSSSGISSGSAASSDTASNEDKTEMEKAGARTRMMKQRGKGRKKYLGHVRLSIVKCQLSTTETSP